MNIPVPHHILQFGSPQRSLALRIGGLLRSNRVTLGGAILCAWMVPLVLVGWIDGGIGWPGAARDSMQAAAISFVGLLSTHLVLSKIGVIPLSDEKILIFPSALFAFSISYFVISLIFVNSDYRMVLYSFFASLVWYYAIAMARARLTFPHLGFVGGLPSDTELLSLRIKWVPVIDGKIPHSVVGLVFDRDDALTPGQERLLCRAALRQVPVYELAHLREMITGRVALRSSPAEIFGQILPSEPYLRLKRGIDTAVAIPILVAILPVLLVTALAIRLDSPGGAIFRQSRIGYCGRQFICFKFRTMHVDRAGPAYTLEQDHRVTRVGRLLRKWRIDELPQIFNILKGDMSWIGPRPEAVSLARAYQKVIPFYAYRHTVRPGISGWAAVHQGNVALPDAARLKLEFDFYYIRNFSFWLDFLITLMTIRTIVSGFGSR